VHAGWGIFTGIKAAANDWGRLEGPPFTSYRAELRAVVEAFSRAAVPICIYCDNQAVVDQTAELIDRLEALQDGSSTEQPGSGADHDYTYRDPMWDALELIVRRAPERFFKIRWIPGHLLDPGKEAKLENFLAEGGDLALARGNSAVDILAEKGAKLAEPKQSLLWKEFLVMKLAKTFQAMQITIWAAFKGHIASDQEVAAADLARLANWEPADEGTGYDDIDDPFLHEFLAQRDNQEL
jgi:ribonuclease HI